MTLLRMAPIFPVSELAVSLAHYGRLGFATRAYADGDYGYANGVIGTANWLYSWDSGANSGGIGDAHLHKAPRDKGTPWTAVKAPAGRAV